MRLGRHIARTGGAYVCTFGAAETKNGRTLIERLPMALTAYIDRYLAEIRPALLRGHVSDDLSGPLERAIDLHEDLCRDRGGARGRLSPHLFRDALATGIATGDPEHIGIVARLLGHADPRTAERHYIHARAITASRRYNGVVVPIRAAAVAASSEPEDGPCAR